MGYWDWEGPATKFQKSKRLTRRRAILFDALRTTTGDLKGLSQGSLPPFPTKNQGGGRYIACRMCQLTTENVEPCNGSVFLFNVLMAKCLKIVQANLPIATRC